MHIQVSLSGGNGSVSTINISGTADVTLPALPTTRGTGATATITFDGGTLSSARAGGSPPTGVCAGGSTRSAVVTAHAADVRTKKDPRATKVVVCMR